MDAIGEAISWLIRSPFICLGWIIIGAVAGGLARQFMNRPNRPFLSDLILGILGAFVGGFLASLFSVELPDGGLSRFIANLVVATIGAVVLIGIQRMITRS